MERIIGNFLEINSDIVSVEATSKKPKIIKKLRSKFFRFRLLKMVKKLRKQNYILTKENLIEFFTYTFNNFPPYGRYKSVYVSKVHDDRIEAILYIDNNEILIFFDLKEKGFEFTISNHSEDGVNVNHLYCSENLSHKTIQVVADVNEVLKNNICDYLEETISAFK